jgi:hypothetical protein
MSAVASAPKISNAASVCSQVRVLRPAALEHAAETDEAEDGELDLMPAARGVARPRGIARAGDLGSGHVHQYRGGTGGTALPS